jgi:hypothetical protein
VLACWYVCVLRFINGRVCVVCERTNTNAPQLKNRLCRMGFQTSTHTYTHIYIHILYICIHKYKHRHHTQTHRSSSSVSVAWALRASSCRFSAGSCCSSLSCLSAVSSASWWAAFCVCACVRVVVCVCVCVFGCVCEKRRGS